MIIFILYLFPVQGQIIEYAKEDAKKNVYMGEKFKCLRKSEAAKVAPDRASLMATLNQAITFGDMGDMQRIRGDGERWLYVLFGIPYEQQSKAERREEEI